MINNTRFLDFVTLTVDKSKMFVLIDDMMKYNYRFVRQSVSTDDKVSLIFYRFLSSKL